MTEALAIGDPFRLCGGVLAERFRVHSTIAEGGFGVVYRGTQLVLDRSVAIKVLKTPPNFSGEALARFRERFADEAKIIARLKHPHIVDVYDFGVGSTRDGDVVPWMALEWLNGVTLEKDLDARRKAGRGGRSGGEVLALMRPILQAFAMAHRQGIVHRDIKPANIMLTEDGSGARVPKILDFGISKIVEASDTDQHNTGTNGMPAFSPAYAAPEQVTFSRTGTWTDVHALGLVLSELLTGRAPYSAEGLHLFEQVMLARRPTPGTYGVDVGAWEEVIQKALALAPGTRFQNAAELLAALELRSPKRAPEVREIDGGGMRRETLPLLSATGAMPSAAGGTRPLPSSLSESPSESPSTMPAAALARPEPDRRPAPGVPDATSRRSSRVRKGLVAALVVGGLGVLATFALRHERPRPSPTSELSAPGPAGSDRPDQPPPAKPPAEPQPPRPPILVPPPATPPPPEHAVAPGAKGVASGPADTDGPEAVVLPRRPVVPTPAHPRARERSRAGGPAKGPRPKVAPLQPLPIEIE